MSIVPGLVPLSIKEIPTKGKTIIVFTEVLKVGNETNFFNYISQNYYAETNDTFVTLIKLADN